MRRRDISKALFATAAGSALVAQRAEAQTCTAPCFAQTAAEIAAGVTPVNYASPPGYVSRYGANTVPGTTNMSTAIMNAVNSNQGERIYIDTGLTLAAGIILSGSSYSGTEIYCINGSELLFAPNGENFNFKSYLWALVLIQGCDRVVLDLRINANRQNMTETEWIYPVSFMGSTNCYCPSLIIRETRGDGLYIDWYDPTQSTGQTNSQNIVVDSLYVYNTTNDGRNACSVISCNGLTIGQLTSYQVGAVVGGLQLGGLDIEPDFPAQSVTDVVIGNLNVTTNGATGLAIQGLSTSGNDNNQDWNVQRVTIMNARVRQTGSGSFLMTRVWDATVQVDQINLTYHIGAQVDYCNRINLTISLANTTQGLIVGTNGYVFDSNITLYLNYYSQNGLGGLEVTGVERTTFKGKMCNAVSGANAIAVQFNDNSRSLTQTGVVYSLDFPYDANLYCVFYNGTGTGAVTIGPGTCIKDCTMFGFPYTVQTNFQIPSYNCGGRNHGTGGAAAPTNGTWAAFDETVLDQTEGATAPRAKCIAGGSPGTWKLYSVMST